MIKLKEGFSQVCVLQGVILEENGIKDFEDYVKEFSSCRIQFLETIITKPDTYKNGIEIYETGGRSDIFFAVHNDDIGKFAIPRLSIGARWIEDVLADCNYKSHIYPDHVYNYITWNEDSITFPNVNNYALI